MDRRQGKNFFGGVREIPHSTRQMRRGGTIYTDNVTAECILLFVIKEGSTVVYRGEEEECKKHLDLNPKRPTNIFRAQSWVVGL